MEVVAGAVLGALTTSLTSKLITVAEKMCRGKDKESKDLKYGIDNLRKDLAMIYGLVELSHAGQPTLVTVSMDEFRVVAHDIEDCLDRFLPCAACGGGKIHGTKEFRDEIAELREKLEGAVARRKNYGGDNQEASDSARSNVDDKTHLHTGTYEACPAVGMEEPKHELWESLVVGEGSKLKVISIVGFGGSGKTALASAVYNCDKVKEQFPRRAWAMASKYKDNAGGLLTAILEELLGDEAQAVPLGLRLGELQQRISHQLETTRCLIVVDDINLALWTNIIKPMLSKEKTQSRVLVTTAVISVATTCSFNDGYVYNMRSLSAKHSKDYLAREAFVKVHPSPAFEIDSSAIAEKCYGYPLALVSVAKDLQGHKLTPHFCEIFIQNLSSRMHENGNDNFKKLRQVLMNNYSSLPHSSHKTCLLYASVFPNDRPFSTSSLIRRLSAEGYIEGKKGYQNLDELIDRNIIQPIDVSNNSKVKTCRAHGIMNQLMLHKSRSLNFIATSLSDENRSNCRHLVIQNHRNSNSFAPATSGKGKQLRPRSLTVFGSAGQAVSDLTSCELLRVLDLKECNDLKDQHLEYIYKLLHLKYLTLGSSTNKTFDGMARLHCLETLDMRTRKIETLPVEVISLPHLVHLFGRIKLNKLDSKKLNKFQSGECNLETLAGVVVDNNSGFPGLMVHMKNLTKVKIWCEATIADDNYALLSKGIQKFVMAGLDTPTCHRSLSLHLNGYSEDLLHHHQRNNANTTSTNLGYLRSLKLQGKPTKLRQFLMCLDGLAELCLTSGNLTGDVLSGLDTLQRLVCLKLVQVHLGDLDINHGDFPSLQHLCLVVQEPRFPTIQHGALPSLTSIQLLCEDLEDVCDIKLEWFKDLQEIALDSMVNPEIIKLWEDKAKEHPKRPRVSLLQRVVDPAETSPSVKYVASCQVNNNCYTDTCTIDHMAIDLDNLTLQTKYRRSDQFRVGSKRSRSPHSPGRV